MTLEKLKNKFFSHGADDSTMYVFDDEDSADDYIDYKYFGDTSKIGFEVAFTLHSAYASRAYLKRKWLKAKVEWFKAVGMNEMVVVIRHPEADEETRNEHDCNTCKYKYEPRNGFHCDGCVNFGSWKGAWETDEGKHDDT